MAYGYNLAAILAEKAVAENPDIGEINLTAEELALEAEVRKELTDKYAEEISLTDKDKVQSLYSIIRTIMQSSDHKPYKTAKEFDRVFLRIAKRITSYGKLDDYLRDPSIEEININSFDQTEIKTRTRTVFDYKIFRNAEECKTISLRVLSMGDLTLDQANPVGDATISQNTRGCGIVYPIVPDEKGPALSIRKLKEETLTREELVEGGTASDEMMDFMELVVGNGVCAGFVGPVGSGKTTDLNYFMSCPSTVDKRVFVTEEGAREIKRDKRDANGNLLTRTIYTKTRPSDNPQIMNVDQTVLTKVQLRFDADIFLLSEMRGKEAQAVVDACSAGRPVYTTFHTDSPDVAYSRIADMYRLAPEGANVPYQDVMNKVYQAFPILWFKDKMKDDVRRCTDMTEAYRKPDGTYEVIPIFEFKFKNVYGGTPRKFIRIDGYYEQVNYISNALAYKMLRKGADFEEVRRFAKPGYNPDTDKNRNGPVEEQRIPEKVKQTRLLMAAVMAEADAEAAPADKPKQSDGEEGQRIYEMEQTLAVDDPVRAAKVDEQINSKIDKIEETKAKRSHKKKKKEE